MEITTAVVKDYFEAIHNSLRENDLSCINRYKKGVITQSRNSEINRIADYPFNAYRSSLYFFLLRSSLIFTYLLQEERLRDQYTPFKRYLSLLDQILILTGRVGYRCFLRKLLWSFEDITSFVLLYGSRNFLFIWFYKRINKVNFFIDISTHFLSFFVWPGRYYSPNLPVLKHPVASSERNLAFPEV